MTEHDAYIALNMITDVGPVRVRAMAAALGSAEAIFSADEGELLKVEGVGRDLARRIVAERGRVDPEAEAERAAELGARIIAQVDADYPEPLKAIHDPPLALYAMGTLEKKDRHAIAIVGSRRCTHYGRQTADRLAYGLAKVGFVVVSGLARGIDTEAHRGALKGGGRTIAVLGSALDRMYPPGSEELAAAIAGQGAVISEYPMGREPDRTTFPYRNRVVSGLSMGVVVVEAPLQSGALITADMALEQGRSVFAVPGRIDSPAAQGCHRLIKAGARLVEDVDDVLEEFELLVPPGPKEKAEALRQRPDVALSPDEEKVVRALGDGPTDIDSLARGAGLKSAAVSSLLLGLEMKRVVRMLPGRIVELTARLEDIKPS